MMTTLEKMFKSLTTIKGLEKIKTDVEGLAKAIIHLSSAVQIQSEEIHELYAMLSTMKKTQAPGSSTSPTLDLTLNKPDKKNVKPN